jgi:hypothetical protein
MIAISKIHLAGPKPIPISFLRARSGLHRKRTPVIIKNQAKIVIKNTVLPSKKLSSLKNRFLMYKIIVINGYHLVFIPIGISKAKRGTLPSKLLYT